jgi:hypothetical protein
LNFTILQEQTKDLPSQSRKAVFDSLPSTLQDEAWLNHAKWVASRTLLDEWLSTETPFSFKEWLND